MNTTDRGTKSEAVSLAALVKNEWTVLIPFGPCRYDLAAEKGGEFVRIQCKTGWKSKGCLVFSTASIDRMNNSRLQYDNDADVFMVYYPEEDKLYWVPVKGAPKGFGNLRIDPPANNQLKGIKWASEYEWGISVSGNTSACHAEITSSNPTGGS